MRLFPHTRTLGRSQKKSREGIKILGFALNLSYFNSFWRYSSRPKAFTSGCCELVTPPYTQLPIHAFQLRLCQLESFSLNEYCIVLLYCIHFLPTTMLLQTLFHIESKIIYKPISPISYLRRGLYQGQGDRNFKWWALGMSDSHAGSHTT